MWQAFVRTRNLFHYVVQITPDEQVPGSVLPHKDLPLYVVV